MKITARKLPSGSWRCQITVDGKRVSVTASTKREAERKAAALATGYEKRPKGSARTLRQAIEGYIKDKDGVLSPATVRGYDQIMRNYMPRLMDKTLGEITVPMCQSAVSAMAKTYAPRTVKNAWGLVKTVLRYNQVITKDDAVTLPQMRKAKLNLLQRSEVYTLLSALEGDKCELPILMALWLGMRRGEIFGLCWDSVDLKRETITIRRDYVASTHGMVLKDIPKTTGSERTIQLPAYLLKLFRQMPQPLDRSARVFAMFDAGLPRKRLQRVCRQAGITESHLHGLRHTFAALMLREGVERGVVADQGGWSTLDTVAKIYDYIMEEDRQDAAKTRDDIFLRGREAK